jgi:hypothetical protein
MDVIYEWREEAQLDTLNSVLTNVGAPHDELLGNLFLAAHIPGKLSEFPGFLRASLGQILDLSNVTDDAVHVVCSMIRAVCQKIDMSP